MKLALALCALAATAMAAPTAGADDGDRKFDESISGPSEIAVESPNMDANLKGQPKAAGASDTISVKYCDSANWNGRCNEPTISRRVCYNVSGGWNDVISCFGPVRGTTCYLYENAGCKGRSISTVHPGKFDLSKDGFNDIISSYYCS